MYHFWQVLHLQLLVRDFPTFRNREKDVGCISYVETKKLIRSHKKMTLSKTPIEIQLQRNSSVIMMKNTYFGKSAASENKKVLRTFEFYRNNSCDPLECNAGVRPKVVRRHQSELIQRRPSNIKHQVIKTRENPFM